MARLPGVKECPPLARLDPMGRIDPLSMTFGADADNIAEALLPYDAQGENYFVNAARSLVSGVIMQTKKWFSQENLVTVYHTIAGRNLSAFAQDAMPGGSRYASSPEHQFILDRLSLVANAGDDDRHVHSVVSTANVGLQFIGNPASPIVGAYLVKECVRLHGNEGGGAGDGDEGRAVPLDRVIGSPLPCPWCGANRGHYHCDCGAVVCGGKVDERRNKFYCRVSCGRSWEIGRDAKETRVSEARRGGDWQAPQRSGACGQF